MKTLDAFAATWGDAIEAAFCVENLLCASDLLPGMLVQSTMFEGRVMEVVYKLPWGHHGQWKVVFYDSSWLMYTYDGAGDDPIWYRVECPD
jgi:hypothetical protein